MGYFLEDQEGNPSRTRRELNVIQAEDAQLARDQELGSALRRLHDAAAANAAEEEKAPAAVAVAEEKAAPADASPT